MSGREALRIIDENEIDLVLTDLVMHDVTGMDVLRAAKQRHPDCEVIVISGQGGVEAAVDAMKAGAATYVRKPLRVDEVRAVVQKQIDRLTLLRRRERTGAARRRGATAWAGDRRALGQAMRNVLTLVAAGRRHDATVLILGESGTGKELVARAIHETARARRRPFVAINCAALPETLLESELFGHERGAFTGAVAQTERASSSRPTAARSSSTRSARCRSRCRPSCCARPARRARSTASAADDAVTVDVRVVAATNRDLEAAVNAGRFREDLYYRLNVVDRHASAAARARATTCRSSSSTSSRSSRESTAGP